MRAIVTAIAITGSLVGVSAAQAQVKLPDPNGGVEEVVFSDWPGVTLPGPFISCSFRDLSLCPTTKDVELMCALNSHCMWINWSCATQSGSMVCHPDRLYTPDARSDDTK